MEINETGSSYYARIAARAATLRERIEEPERFSFHRTSDQQFNRRLSEWCKVIAPDDPGMFAKRLQNDGINESELELLLGSVTIAGDDQLPGWIQLFRDLMDFLCAREPVVFSSGIQTLFGADLEKSAPFIHLLIPMVEFARNRLIAEVGNSVDHLFAAEASGMLNRQLAGSLLLHACQTFQLEFQVFIAPRQSSIDRFFGQLIPGQVSESGLYFEFISKMSGKGWIPFFEEYSVLARTLTTVISNWITNTGNFIRRLVHDQDEIAAHFAGGISPGRLTEYKGGISDSHNHGTGVITLKFESGLKLVYKPKNLELEVAFASLLNWFNEKGLNPSMKTLDVLHQGDYGWVGFIGADECKSEEDVKDYYNRIGALIGIIYMLNGNDCHRENLIACGAHPVIIDLETIMHPVGKAFGDEFTDSAAYLANEQFGNSVFRTGLLPSWMSIKDGSVIDVSGIGGYGNPLTHFKNWVWKEINTDRMLTELENIRVQDQPNLPVFAGEKRLPASYTSDIVAGFTALYRLVLEHRKQVPLHLFAGKELRFIFRSTRIYGRIMKNLVDPGFMREGIDGSIRLELVCRAFLHTVPPDPFWSISKSERRQMEELDTPIFWAGSGDVDLRDNAGIVMEDYLRCPVYEQVVSKLAELDENDLAIQVKLIRASLYFREIDHGNLATPLHFPVVPVDHPAATPEILIQSAIDIAHSLYRDAIFSPDGSCSWLTMGIIPGTEKYRMQPMSTYLYDGFAGVALFLSALISITDDPVIKKLHEATIKSLKRGIDSMAITGTMIRLSSLGIAVGLPSVIYSLMKISEFHNDKTFLDEAVRLIGFIDEIMIRQDQSHDILAGNAGCILALLLVYRATGFTEILEKAIACGNQLLDTAVETPGGNLVWKTVQGLLLTGFSHGVAGMAHALLKLFEVTGDQKYLQAATRGIRYENSLFSAERQNWADLREFPDLPDAGEPRFMTAWCHGATGIGFARLAGRDINHNEDRAADILAAIETTKRDLLQSRDHLCCGNMGRIEFLFYASLKENDESLRKIAFKTAGYLIERASKNGHYDLLTDGSDGFTNPGFFQGVSGIGYEFLRMVYPEKFPSVLIFE